MKDAFDLARFVAAQDPVYDRVLSELGAGRKRSHWIWFIFPQLVGLGHSATAVKYSISNSEEAKAYLGHPILGPRLRECSSLVLRAELRSIDELFEFPDNLKFRSSMTLFDYIAPGEIFGQALQKFFEGRGDQATLAPLIRSKKRPL